MATAPNWAAWRHDQPTAQHWAPQVARALNTGLDARTAAGLARDYGATQPGPRAGRTDAELAAAALAWLAQRGYGTGIESALTPVLRGIRTDGYLLGAASAYALTDAAPAHLGGWKPGDSDDARSRLADLGDDGLDQVYAGQDESAAFIGRTHRQRIARALALGVIAGHAPTAVAAAVLAIAARDSDGISLTELLLASGAAVYALYRRRRITTVQWAIDPRSKVCARCRANADEGVVPLGHVFSSGDITTPAHNRCACALIAA